MPVNSMGANGLRVRFQAILVMCILVHKPFLPCTIAIGSGGKALELLMAEREMHHQGHLDVLATGKSTRSPAASKLREKETPVNLMGTHGLHHRIRLQAILVMCLLCHLPFLPCMLATGSEGKALELLMDREMHHQGHLDPLATSKLTRSRRILQSSSSPRVPASVDLFMVTNGAAPVTATTTGWRRGRVKAVPSGDTVEIMKITTIEMPLEVKSLTLSTVYFGEENIACLLVAVDLAKVKEQGQKGGLSPYVAELLRLEGLPRTRALDPIAIEELIGDLPPSTTGDGRSFDAKGFIAENKGKSLEAFVEHVRDRSIICVHLIASSFFVQIYVASLQAPSMGRRTIPNAKARAIGNGKASEEASATSALTAAQKLVASPDIYSNIPPKIFGEEAKHFTEIRVLNRLVRIVLEGADNLNNIVGSVYYSDGDVEKDLALEQVQNGLVNQFSTKKITRKVIEVVNGYCIVIADDADPSAERQVNLSSIRPPKLERSAEENKSSKQFAHVAKEFLRTRLIGKQVNVSMEYSRRINKDDG
uniref:TNase-like domain-containing protein n=1 Tax=Leersia perrieri TaxID=77586 RepID=A0A0D9VDS2_9ORYZ